MYNKKFYPGFLVIIVLFLSFNCFEEEDGQPKGPQTKSPEKTTKAAQQAVVNFDSLLAVILPIENEIMSNPSARPPVERLLGVAYNKDAGLFYCVGKGVINPKHPVASQQQGMRRAARSTGERWALYLKAWQKDSEITLENKISGKLQASVTLLYEKMEGDTLYQLLAIPSDSVQLL